MNRLLMIAILAASAFLAAASAGPQQTWPGSPAATERPPAPRFSDRVEKLLSAAPAKKANWGILVVDAETGETLYSLAADKYFIPASNMKILTTVLALAALGPDYRFRTTLETRGTLSPEGRLSGDLILVGRGDPNLSNRKFPFLKQPEHDGPPEKILAELADAAVAHGVREIAGDVLADDSYFSRERYPSGWEIDDMVWSYGAAVSAIAVNDNTVTLELRPAERVGERAPFTVEPWTEAFQVQDDVTTSAAGAKPDLTLTREPGAPLVVVRGTLPLGAEPRKLILAVEEPAEHAARLLKRLLEQRGVKITGVARAQHEPPAFPTPSQILAEHLSVPLTDSVRVVNKMSENLHAEMLLRAAVRRKGPWATPDDLFNTAGEFFQSVGIEPGEFLFTDGSGLSRRDLVTPQAVVRVLQYAARQPWAEPFAMSLPVAGEDGTLADRMKKSPAAGRIRAKTGSVERVSALSGYAETLSGKKLVFSIFANNHAGKNSDVIRVIDAICVAMVEELGKPASGECPLCRPEREH